MKNNESPGPPSSRHWWWVAAALGLLAAMLAGMAFIRSHRLPELTQARFDTARARWEANAPSSYKVRVEVRGMQPGSYEVVVENQLPVSASFDGRPLTRPRTFGTWSVNGMFETIAQDLATDEQQNSLMLGAEFNASLGIPLRYERIELRTGAHDALQWEVTQFEPLE